ncbi:hypothetical protein EYZ11_005578 [Aspergillus tanneri]|uniref:Uncharacterized protein n=1 Tax=Aspergillus tanneri TaxID=1220188 RepID=A0A4S3JHL6_9EURO|nr:uncharacterized protein ATNIH1004_010999 [Aspergillus tanneri]KAA8642059.1 hypothetical protein ATNIH1004_010999 [Aspergillus tanneri]THC94939.1 hypothetical protein EYZ11_005578 [Aspergillus tanneri]
MALILGLLALATTTTQSPLYAPLPMDCPRPTWHVTNFHWYNGSQSLDCVHNEVDRQAQGCLCTGGWCKPDPATCPGVMVPLCATGMPNYEPWGYGPKQTLDIKFKEGPTCHDEYIGYRIHDIGNGPSNCGYADRGEGRIISFFGTTNLDESMGHLEYTLGHGYALQCEDGRKITYSGRVDFKLNCVHDAFFNATCTAEPFDVPVLTFEYV